MKKHLVPIYEQKHPEKSGRPLSEHILMTHYRQQIILSLRLTTKFLHRKLASKANQAFEQLATHEPVHLDLEDQAFDCWQKVPYHWQRTSSKLPMKQTKTNNPTRNGFVFHTKCSSPEYTAPKPKAYSELFAQLFGNWFRFSLVG